MDYYCFSENLKRLRKERGLSQRQLAKRMNVSQPVICAWENNMKYPLLDKVYDAARVLGVEVTELLLYPKSSVD